MTCTIALCATLIAASPDRVTIIPTDGPDHYAVALIENRRGLYHRTETHDTAHGPVSIEYTTTLPSTVGDPASADTACVVALPDGVVAVPMCVQIMEQETGQIWLIEFVGG